MPVNRGGMYKKMELAHDSNKYAWEPMDSFRSGPGNVETCWKIPSRIGRGTITEFNFKSGIQVFIHDYETSETFASQNDNDLPSFGFRFCISGNTKLDLRCLKESLIVKTGESGFFYFPGMDGSYEDRPCTHIHKVLILVKPSFLGSFMGEETYKLPMKIKAPLNDEKGSSDACNFTDVITSSMNMPLRQLIHCPYDGPTRHIFIEAKAMELIACKLDQIRPATDKRQAKPSLKKSDIDRIHHAKKLLLKNLLSPPSTIELARAIGVSRTKLYKGFNQLYGTSPMECLRLKRIETARDLVKDKDLSLTQIAHSLGYSSSSHFAKAFREFFGMPPSCYRQS